MVVEYLMPRKPAPATDRALRHQLLQALRAAVAKLASGSVVLDMRAFNSIADYFLICQGANPRQTQSIAEAIEMALAPRHGLREGFTRGEWIVLDYMDFVVHIFTEKTRNFYGLERLWRQAPQITAANLAHPPRTPAAQAKAQGRASQRGQKKGVAAAKKSPSRPPRAKPKSSQSRSRVASKPRRKP